MAGYQVLLYNGNDGSPYGKIHTFSSNDVFIGRSGVNFWVIDTPGIQNGGIRPDGVALVDSSNNVVEFISYEGSFVGKGGPADGMTSTDILVQQNGSVSENDSLQRTGAGCSGSDFSTWGNPQPNSRGGVNVGQTIQCEEGGGEQCPTTIIHNYNAYSLEIQCGESYGYAVRFSYELVGNDTSNFDRLSSYSYDDSLPRNCQQKSRSSYSHPQCTSDSRQSNEYCFDRGHLVMANHIDNSEVNMVEANRMTNILPQATGFNQAGGAWHKTEEIIECARDSSIVEKQVIFGGALYTDTSNDYFLESHGIPTPDTFWKVVVRNFTNNDSKPQVGGWVFPNHYTSSDDKLWSEYLTPVAEIQRLTGDRMPELPSDYSELSIWKVPTSCDKS